MNSITLEDSAGNRIDNPSETQILSTLEKIGSSLDHCILDLGNAGFLQAAGSKNRLLIQYDTGSGLHESVRSDFDTAAAARIFIASMNGKSEWKTEIAFSRVAAGDAGDAGSSLDRAEDSEPKQNRSLKDQLLDTVKKEAESVVSRLIGKGIRGLFGKKF